MQKTHNVSIKRIAKTVLLTVMFSFYLIFNFSNTSFAGFFSTKVENTSDSAVIFVYHRIGEDQYPASNLRIEQFDMHLRELTSGKYNVLAVSEIVETLKSRKKLPPNTIGITFEGGYSSTLKNAIPRLLDNKLPFTLFVASDRIDRKSDHYISWKKLKKLNKNKYIDIGALPSSYQHIAFHDKKTLNAQLNRSISRLKEELDMRPQLFSYPFGEYTPELKKTIQQYDYIAAFGQHSGVTHAQSDFYQLPRFSMTESYGDLERFQLTAQALPLAVSDITPQKTVLDEETNPPVIGFTLNGDINGIARLSCFASDQGRITTYRIPSSNRIELRPDIAFSEGRVRINCTMPSGEISDNNQQRWRWFGMMFIIPEKDEEIYSFYMEE